MAVTRAPRRSAPTPVQDQEANEAKVLEVIGRGGSVAADQINPVSTLADEQSDPLKNVQLRLYKSTLEEIDHLRRRHARGRKPLSRHAWLLQAIEEKLQKERRKLD
ncbi:hypothetical protein GCM10022631_07070 [Deinococcus rubellus]